MRHGFGRSLQSRKRNWRRCDETSDNPSKPVARVGGRQDIEREAVTLVENQRCPDGGAHGGADHVAVLDIEHQPEAAEVGSQRALHPQVVEVIVRVVNPEQREILRDLKDAGDGYPGRRRIVECGRRAATNEALQLEPAVGFEDAMRSRPTETSGLGDDLDTRIKGGDQRHQSQSALFYDVGDGE